MAKISITELAQELFYTPTNNCAHSMQHERDVTSKWRHSVGYFTSYPFQLSHDVGKW